MLGDLVSVGETPLQNMPCKGTEGKPVLKEVAGVNLGDQIEVSGLFAGVQGAQNKKKATGMTAAHVATVNIGQRQADHQRHPGGGVGDPQGRQAHPEH